MAKSSQANGKADEEQCEHKRVAQIRLKARHAEHVRIGLPEGFAEAEINCKRAPVRERKQEARADKGEDKDRRQDE